MKKLGLIVMVFLLSGVSGVFAQTPRELRLGTSTAGFLSAGEEQWFSVRAAEFGFIIVETSGDLDTLLRGYNTFNDLIGTDDDSGDGYNARLEIVAEAGRTYLFCLSCYNDEDNGQYRIWASFRPIPASRELRAGAPVSGSLNADEDHWYSFRPSQAGYITVETSGYTDTVLKAYDDSYNFIATDDDGGTNYNAKLEILAEAGRLYHFQVIAYIGEESGQYSIWAEFDTIPPDTERNTDRSRAVTLRLGEPFMVYLRSDSESRWYRYDMPRQAWFIVQTRGSLDTYMYLYDINGNLIAEDDDSGENSNALISERLNSGTVFIEVREYSGETGRFSLHAEIR